MRIIAGALRGRRLATTGRTRPTTAAARETLFNLLAPRIAGAVCLDLFAGSGALAIEAVSRGARRAVLVESDPKTAAKIAATIRGFGGEAALTLVRADARRFLRATRERFEIVFLDPPYALFPDDAAWKRLLDALAPRLQNGALAFCESAADFALPPPWALFRKIDRRRRLLIFSPPAAGL